MSGDCFETSLIYQESQIRVQKYIMFTDSDGNSSWPIIKFISLILNEWVIPTFKLLKRLLFDDSKRFFLSMNPGSHYDFLVDLNGPRAGVEFHKMFKYPELLMISGRIRTAMVVNAKTPSDIYQVCAQRVCACVLIRVSSDYNAIKLIIQKCSTGT